MLCVIQKHNYHQKIHIYQGQKYLKILFVNNKTFGIVNINGIKITDKEKTFVDCINKPELAGGGEHLVTTLELIGKLDGTKILKYLTYYNSKKLYAKVGFMLEWLNYVFDVPKK